MLVAKGKTLPDGSYLWECNKCHGHNPNCDWCYGKNTERIIEAMKAGARGQRYYALLKAFLSVEGKHMIETLNTTRNADNKTSIAAIGWLADKFGLNFKATCEWLEETGTIPTGIYEHIKDQGWKVSDIIEAGKKQYGQLPAPADDATL